MKKWTTLRGFCALAVMGLAIGSASAASVSFTVGDGIAQNYGNGGNLAGITLTANPAVNLPLVDNVVTDVTTTSLLYFGTFSATISGNYVFNNDTFTVHINVTDPASIGGGSTVADLSGKLHKSGDTVGISFDPVTLPTAGLPGLTFDFSDISDLDASTPQKLVGTVTYLPTGSVGSPAAAAVPLPASVYSGLTLLGLLGAAKLRRRLTPSSSR